MCDKIQKLIDEANEEKDKKIAEQSTTISELAAENARLKAQLAAAKG